LGLTTLAAQLWQGALRQTHAGVFALLESTLQKVLSVSVMPVIGKLINGTQL
jgi:hypothetical protein